MHDVREFNCEVDAFGELTHDTRPLRLKILEGGPLSFSAGQYAKVVYPNAIENITRSPAYPAIRALSLTLPPRLGCTSSSFPFRRVGGWHPVTVTAPMGIPICAPIILAHALRCGRLRPSADLEYC